MVPADVGTTSDFWGPAMCWEELSYTMTRVTIGPPGEWVGEWVLIHFVRQQRAELGLIRGTHREPDCVSSSRENFLCQSLPAMERISWWSGEATVAGSGQAVESLVEVCGQGLQPQGALDKLSHALPPACGSKARKG